MQQEPIPWKNSLHGGHSSAYCDHARSPLRAMLEAAVAEGYTVFGVTEHAPRTRPEYLYPEELELGWDVRTLKRLFKAYAAEVHALSKEFEGRLTVLCGMETEVVPAEDYAELMAAHRKDYGFDYMVGSVHHVDGMLIDYDPDTFARAIARYGGLEGLALRYYQALAEMVNCLRPEVVGHFDLIRKYAPDDAAVSSPAIRRGAGVALDAMAEAGAILDLNLAGLRKGLGRPYVAPWLVKAAQERGIAFCFGDDSHSVADVGAGLEAGRQYLLDLGVDTIERLNRRDGVIVRETVSLR